MNKRTIALTTEQYKEIIQTISDMIFPKRILFSDCLICLT